MVKKLRCAASEGAADSMVGWNQQTGPSPTGQPDGRNISFTIMRFDDTDGWTRRGDHG
jgi:hypothetical protein